MLEETVGYVNEVLAATPGSGVPSLVLEGDELWLVDGDTSVKFRIVED